MQRVWKCGNPIFFSFLGAECKISFDAGRIHCKAELCTKDDRMTIVCAFVFCYFSFFIFYFFISLQGRIVHKGWKDDQIDQSLRVLFCYFSFFIFYFLPHCKAELCTKDDRMTIVCAFYDILHPLPRSPTFDPSNLPYFHFNFLVFQGKSWLFSFDEGHPKVEM